MIKQYKLSEHHTLTNCYIQCSPVYSIDAINEFIDGLFVSSSCNISLTDFLTQLVDYTTRNVKSFREGNHVKLGVVFKFLLDHERPLTSLKNITNDISWKIGFELPFWSYFKKEKDCFYLFIYFSDRYFYPLGKRFDKVAKKNIYRDSKTGKICKASDPNAIIAFHAGDILSSTTSTFSKKTRRFEFDNKTHFKKYMNSLKSFYAEALEENEKWSVTYGITLKRFRYDGLSHLQRKNAHAWNNAFKGVEDYFNDNIERLVLIELFDDNKKEINNLYLKIKSISESKHFKYDTNSKVKGSISLWTRKKNRRDEYIDAYKDRCKKEIDATFVKIQQAIWND